MVDPNNLDTMKCSSLPFKSKDNHIQACPMAPSYHLQGSSSRHLQGSSSPMASKSAKSGVARGPALSHRTSELQVISKPSRPDAQTRDAGVSDMCGGGSRHPICQCYAAMLWTPNQHFGPQTSCHIQDGWFHRSFEIFGGSVVQSPACLSISSCLGRVIRNVVVDMVSFREAFALSAAEVNECTPPGTVRILGQSKRISSPASAAPTRKSIVESWIKVG